MPPCPRRLLSGCWHCNRAPLLQSSLSVICSALCSKICSMTIRSVDVHTSTAFRWGNVLPLAHGFNKTILNARVQEYQAASHNFTLSTAVYQVPAKPTLLPMSICPITSCQPVSAIYCDVNIQYTAFVGT
ncbi:hypothetical protein GYMLUDRAFT_49390 [Collybiopsis luxurians FD-317 M1]|uniref:Unplaced genomic scaffold GYMLUscaffold_82, whole genome shotgun sequence n=1 Tax=Collybiopsis luxurians FD-317 M1 TaxID=944289 RepID=A0A0D0C6D5_9AGAR|nr:hypothetical protein GYMLUDRAFT_49390 [Collybiopsis luxurians FD-317 M1]